MTPEPPFCLSWPARLLVGLVQGYRLLLSPWLGSACRFTPTCSAYALEALQRHGARRGAALSAGRLLRCHPWCAGGHDPVPTCPPRRGGPAAGRPPGPLSSSSTEIAP